MDITEFAILLPITMGIVEVFKRTFLTARFLPLMALVVGVALSGFATGWTTASIFTGLILGLSAMGLWSGTKTTVQK